MKKKLLSLALCIAMVLSLFPAVGIFASAEDGEPVFDYAVATDANGGQWTVDDITQYESNSSLSDDYSLGNDLYYKVGNDYYPVGFVDDPEYFYKAYSARRTIKIYNNFSADSPGAWKNNYGRISAKGDNTDVNFFVFYDNDFHCVYYNTHGRTGRYQTTLYIYKNDRFSDACYSSSSTTFDNMKRAGTVLLLDNDHSTPSSTLSEQYYSWQDLGATVGTSNNYYAEDNLTAPQLYLLGTEGAGKKAIVYTDENGNQIDYIARKWKIESTNAANPGNPTYDGKLYYKRDLTQVPVEDPDPTPTTTPTGDEPGSSIINPGGVNDAGFKLQKSLEENTSGTYDIHMESYSTANTVKYGIVEKVPTDFIVIADQSGSMDTKDMATGYTPVSGTKTLEDCASGSYYYKDGDNYYRVYGTKDYLMEYHPSETKWTQNIINDAGYDLSWFQGEDEATFSQSNQYYYKTNDGVYRPIMVTATGKIGTYYVKLSYKDANGNTVPFIRPTKPIYKNVFGGGDSKYGPNSLGYSAVNPLVLAAYPDTDAYTYSEFIGVTTGMYINYPMYTRHIGYSKLCYRDVNGVEHLIGPANGNSVAEYCNSSGQAVVSAGSADQLTYSGLYQASGTETRLAALKGAMTEFVKAVAAESDSKDGLNTTCPVDNRIAIVGFSSLNDGWAGQYNNTEILTGENLTVRNNNGVYYDNASTSDYASALVSATDGQIGADHVNSKLTEAISAITANGGTQPEYGFQMAKNIMDNRALTEYTLKTGDKSTKKRNVVVIYFTDGQPGDYYISNQYSEANDVVSSALPLKTAGAKIFSIGVFGESDGNPLTYYDRTATQESQTTDWKFLGGWMETYKENGTYYCMRRQWRPAGAEGNHGYTPEANDTIYDYMSVTSSNYPGAQQFIAPGWLSGNYSGTYTEATDGIRHKETSEATNKFYRMAASQATLVEAFKQSVAYASTQQQNADVVNLNTTSIFRDEVNTEDFDVSHATYSVTWQPIKVDPSLVTPDHPSAIGELENDPDFPVVTPVVNQPMPANGVIEYSGFDYGANFVSMAKTKGYKLIVEVNGIIPTTYNETIASNVDPDPEHEIYGCAIFEAGKDEPAYSVKSPTLYYELHEPTTTDVVMNKTISDPSPTDGSYTITLDAYATGNFDDADVKLDKDGYLQDIIDLDNLAVRADLSEPIVTVKTQKGTADRNGNISWDDNEEDITDRVTVSYNGDTGAVKVTGFDYSANFIGYPKPMNIQEDTDRHQGKKIIVEISGLVPKHPGSNQTSNDKPDAGVYDKENNEVVSKPSPTFSITQEASKSFVIDFSAPMTVAEDAKSVAKMSGNNGDFTLVGTDVVYQLTKSVGGHNLILDGVDQAFTFAKPVGMKLDNAAWSVITTIPAGSVYFDDDFASLTSPITVGDGSGHNSAVSVSPAKDNEKAGQQSFTFYGTGIDIYCTTNSDGGYVQAKLTQNGAAVNGQPNQTVKNYTKETERYNVPSISFTGLEPGEYTVTLNILGSSNYKLDGVRVYNPISDQTQYTGDAASEKYATYINMRDALVNNVANTTFNDNQMDDDTVVGALFVDDSEKLDTFVTATEEQIAAGKDLKYFDAEGKEVSEGTEGAIAKIRAYKNDFAAYKANSPKHEIYLEGGESKQAIIFQLSDAAQTAAANGNLWIGLSAPDQGKNTGTLTLTDGKTIKVTSGVDMYYPITSDKIGADGVVTLANTGDNMISVTNLKITGNETIYNASNNIANTPNRSMAKAMASAPASDDVIPMVFAPLTKRTVMLAANNGVDPEAVVEPDEPDDPSPTTEPETTPTVTPDPTPTPVVTPDPTPTPTPNSGNSFVKVVTNIVKSLLKSISRLFGR